EYEPRPSDAQALAEAELVVRAGGEIDGWLEELIEAAGGDAPQLVLLDAVLAGDGEVAGGRHGAEPIPTGSGGEPDPHWWLDPRNALVALDAIAARLVALDPAGAALYRRNARSFAAQLRALDRRIARCFRALPAERRKLVTGHDSLGWF